MYRTTLCPTVLVATLSCCGGSVDSDGGRTSSTREPGPVAPSPASPPAPWSPLLQTAAPTYVESSAPDPDRIALHPPGNCASNGDGSLGVAGGHVYWTRLCSDQETAKRTWIVAAAPAAGGATTIAFAADANGATYAVDAHVAFQLESASQVYVLAAGTTSATPLPGSVAPCAALTTDPSHVLCVTRSVPQRLLEWAIAGGGPTEIESDLGDDVTSIQVSAGDIYLGRHGHGCTSFKGTTTCDGKGAIVRRPRSGGGETIVKNMQAPARLALAGATLAWRNDKMSQSPHHVSPPYVKYGATTDSDDYVVGLADTSDVFGLVSHAVLKVRAYEDAGGGPHWVFERKPPNAAPVLVKSEVRRIDAVAADANRAFWSTDGGIFARAL